MSARNRELLTLLLAGLVASTAFASAWIADAAQLDQGWLPYAALLGGVFLAGHLVARVIVPDADPTLLPLAALLCAIGLTFVYRIAPEDGRRQLGWVAIGVLAFALVLVWLRYDYRVLERYKYVFGVSAIVLLMLPSVPGLGERINGVKLWVNVGPLQFQPGEIAKIFLVIFLAGYLRDKREALARGRLKDFGPLLADLGRRDARPRPDERPRLGAPQLRDLPRDALRRHREAVVRRRRARPLRRRRRGALQRARPRAAARHGLARAVDRREGLLHDQRGARVPPELRLVPAREEPLLDRERRLRRHGDRQRHVPDRRRDAADPVPADGLRLLGDRAGARSHRRRRRAPPLPRARRAHDARRADRAGRLLEAARSGARLRLRAADVHHRRRRPPARPADGDHAPVRLVRRLEHRLELRDARARDARLEPCRPRSARRERAS